MVDGEDINNNTNKLKIAGDELNDSENALVKNARDHKPSILEGDIKDNTIRAEVINRLIKGIAFEGDTDKNPKQVKVELTNAFIKDKIDLTEVSGANGDFAPSLILKDCHIPELIDVSFARLKTLSFNGCKITQLLGEGLGVDGNVDLSDVESYEKFKLNKVIDKVRDKGLCQVALQMAKIGGDLIAERARFCSFSSSNNSEESNDRKAISKYALYLRNTRIHGRVNFSPMGRANGGISFQDANIGGDIWANGCNLITQTSDAFNGQSLQLGGSLILSSTGDGEDRTRIEGTIRLKLAKINNNVDLSGACIKAYTKYSIILEDAYIGSDLIMAASNVNGVHTLFFDVKGKLSLIDTHIRGNVIMDGAKISPIFGSTVLDAQGIQIGKDLILSTWSLTNEKNISFESKGKIFLEHAIISGDLLVQNAELKSYLMYEGFSADDITVGGNLDFRPKLYYPASFERCTVKGRFILGDTDNKPAIKCFLGSQEEPSISLKGAKIGDALKVRDFAVQKTGRDYLSKKPENYLNQIDKILNNLNEKSGTIENRDWELIKIQEFPLEFLPNWLLVHFIFSDKINCDNKGENEISISCLYDKKNKLIPLDGSSHDIHTLIRQQAFQITEDDACCYLKFYCAYVWGQDGPIHILCKSQNIYSKCVEDKGKCTFKQNNSSANPFQFTVAALFDDELYHFSFEVGKHGEVKMTEDKKIPGNEGMDYHKYNITVFNEERGGDFDTCQLRKSSCKHSPQSLSLSNKDCKEKGVNCKLFKRVVNLLENKVSNDRQGNIFSRVDIDLSRANVGALNDENGYAWGNQVRLFLDDFTYRHISRPEKAPMDQLFSRLSYLRFWSVMSIRFMRNMMYFDRISNFVLSFFQNYLRRCQRFVFSSQNTPQSIEPGLIISCITGKIQDRIRMPEYDGSSSYEKFFDQPWRLRKRWLMLQYRYYYPSDVEFNPQPFRQLEKVYNSQGQHEDALKIAFIRLSIERTFKPFCYRWIFSIYQCFFGFGLVTKRAIFTLLLWLVIGYCGVKHMNTHNILVIDSVPVSTVAMSLPESLDWKIPDYVYGTQSNKANTYESLVGCGNTINPWIYALDVMIPFIDFRQEFRCHIRSWGDDQKDNIVVEGWMSKFDWSISLYKNPDFWLWVKAIYRILGWIITSLTVLTISGILRRQVEGGGSIDTSSG